MFLRMGIFWGGGGSAEKLKRKKKIPHLPKRGKIWRSREFWVGANRNSSVPPSETAKRCPAAATGHGRGQKSREEVIQKEKSLQRRASAARKGEKEKRGQPGGRKRGGYTDQSASFDKGKGWANPKRAGQRVKRRRDKSSCAFDTAAVSGGERKTFNHGRENKWGDIGGKKIT